MNWRDFYEDFAFLHDYLSFSCSQQIISFSSSPDTCRFVILISFANVGPAFLGSCAGDATLIFSPPSIMNQTRGILSVVRSQSNQWRRRTSAAWELRSEERAMQIILTLCCAHFKALWRCVPSIGAKSRSKHGPWNILAILLAIPTIHCIHSFFVCFFCFCTHPPNSPMW